jgi:hypothetical protein
LTRICTLLVSRRSDFDGVGIVSPSLEYSISLSSRSVRYPLQVGTRDCLLKVVSKFAVIDRLLSAQYMAQISRLLAVLIDCRIFSRRRHAGYTYIASSNLASDVVSNLQCNGESSAAWTQTNNAAVIQVSCCRHELSITLIWPRSWMGARSAVDMTVRDMPSSVQAYDCS